MRTIRQPYQAHCERTRGAKDTFLSQLPRSLEGEGLTILGRKGDGIVITDGVRTALYVPCKDKPLTGRLRIEPGNTEPGWFQEAAIVFVGNGRTTILYEPLSIIDNPAELEFLKGKATRRP